MLTQVKRWLQKPGNSKVVLAYHLGYKSSNSIENWFNAGEVPSRVQTKVKRIINAKNN